MNVLVTEAAWDDMLGVARRIGEDNPGVLRAFWRSSSSHAGKSEPLRAPTI